MFPGWENPGMWEKSHGTLSKVPVRPAAFLHPAEAMRGDLGVCQDRDPRVMVSKSGTTSEMLNLVAPPAPRLDDEQRRNLHRPLAVRVHPPLGLVRIRDLYRP